MYTHDEYTHLTQVLNDVQKCSYLHGVDKKAGEQMTNGSMSWKIEYMAWLLKDGKLD